MNPFNLLKQADPELFNFFEKKLDYQHKSLSFIPDENSTSPLCAAILGNVLINNSVTKDEFNRTMGLEGLTCKRICEIFGADHANLRAITIEGASRVVFQALTQRGDIVMSLDLRKKEHCNNENFVYRFENFGVDPKTQLLNYDEIEKKALNCHPHLIIVSPINYPLSIDYARLSAIAKAAGAYLWCDISQNAGLIAAGVLSSPVPYADVVTFRTFGSLQGPQSAVILCSSDLGNLIDRTVTTAGHKGLLTPSLAALACRMIELKSENHRAYARAVVENAEAFAEGLTRGGVKVLASGTQTHLVMVDSKSTALSARGAQELLFQNGIKVRTTDLLTSDARIKFDSIRFSTLPATTRGVSAIAMSRLGEAIAQMLVNPDEQRTAALQELIGKITCDLPIFSTAWVDDAVKSVCDTEAFRWINS
ncbi:MAG: hypothetical protein K6F05_06290 [Succinivibrio sp.]|nr:hypothetical protein [Succinivibrio sp.]